LGQNAFEAVKSFGQALEVRFQFVKQELETLEEGVSDEVVILLDYRADDNIV
jgi:hypothetical protein